MVDSVVFARRLSIFLAMLIVGLSPIAFLIGGIVVSMAFFAVGFSIVILYFNQRKPLIYSFFYYIGCCDLFFSFKGSCFPCMIFLFFFLVQTLWFWPDPWIFWRYNSILYNCILSNWLVSFSSFLGAVFGWFVAFLGRYKHIIGLSK